MAIPVFLLAGQSNARALRDGIVAALTARYGAEGFVLVEVDAAGAPLTFKRESADWYAGDELRAELRAAAGAALAADADARIEGMIWVQGEGDTHAIARAGEYADRLELLIGELRAGIAADFPGRDTGAASARLAISALSEAAPEAEGRDQWQSVIDAQEQVAAGNARAMLVDPDLVAAAHGIAAGEMFLDSLHYASALRPLLAEALVGAASGAVPQAEPPPLVGGDGDDRMKGTTGGERMIGGRGDDTYVFNHPGDRIVELEGEGHDTVLAARSVSLRFHSQFIEDLVMTGAGDIDGTGNGLDNLLIGNRGDNRLDGAWGDDVLRGCGGDDVLVDAVGLNRLIGGPGNDTYVIVHRGNRVIEGAGRGDDTVLSSISFSLRANGRNVERLTLTGDAAIDGTGNGEDNVLTGNGAANRLNGAWGDDAIDGGAGDDWLTGHRGDDVLTGGAGRDVFVFRPGDGHDRITDFDVGEDRLGLDAAIARGQVVLEQQGDDLLVLLGSMTSVLLEGVLAGDLAAYSFFTI